MVRSLLWLYEVPRTVESQMRGAAQSSVCAAVLPRSAPPVSMWQAAEVVVRQLKSRPPLRRAQLQSPSREVFIFNTIDSGRRAEHGQRGVE